MEPRAVSFAPGLPSTTVPHKRPGSSRWQIKRRNLPGFGDVGVIATGVTQRRVAERMEALLDDLAERALLDASFRLLVEAVLDRRLTLVDLLGHHTRGDLDGLRSQLNDPPLAGACDRYVQGARAGQARDLREYSVRVLQALLPARARTSALRDARALERVLYAAERGEPAGPTGERRPRKRNSVRRTVLRAASGILDAEFGRAERDRVVHAVRFAGEDDTREVALTPADVRLVLAETDRLHAEAPHLGYDEMAVALRLMLQTSADRGTLFGANRSGGAGLLVEHVRVREVGRAGDGPGAGELVGSVYIHDTKTARRSRTVPLTDAVCRALLPHIEGKGPSDPVFRLLYAHSETRWKRVRERAEASGLSVTGLRMKDLRAQTAIYAERSGVPLTVAQRVLGHDDDKMTRRYQRHDAAMTSDHADMIERALGLAPASPGATVPQTVYQSGVEGRDGTGGEDRADRPRRARTSRF
jgi:integrase